MVHTFFFSFCILLKPSSQRTATYICFCLRKHWDWLTKERNIFCNSSLKPNIVLNAALSQFANKT